MKKKHEKCYQAKEKEGKIICDITKYKCPFKGEYHVLEDKDGTNYVVGGERFGCEVCYAYNLGQDYEKFKQAKVVVPNDIDDDMKSEITKFFGEDKILQRN